MTTTLQDHKGVLLAAANAFADACTAEAIRRTSGIELQPGERYAGLLLNEDGTPSHHVVLLPGEIADELADVLTYLDLLAATLGVDLGRAAAQKFNEVSERVGFPDRIELAA